MKLLFSAIALIPVFCSSFAVANTLENGEISDSFSTTMVDTRCNVSLGGEIIDYGEQTRWELGKASSGEGWLTPGKRSLMLNIVCPYPQTMQFVLHGDHAANGRLRYGSHGSLNIILRDAMVDNRNVQIAITNQNGILIGPQQSTLALKSDDIYAAVANGEMIKGKVFNAKIDIEPELNENDAKVISTQINESNFTLKLFE